MLLFWNPGCGFCQRMLETLKAWELDRGDLAPEVLVVSNGSREQNLEQGLRSKVALDAGFVVGPKFHATGTPMAVLIDAHGRIASPVAAGEDAVMGLVRANGASANGHGAVQ
jgi:thiol-disulfide isomerase/thioredoxin